MQCLARSNNLCKVSGIGIDLDEGGKPANSIEGINIYSISLKSMKWTFLPKMLMHTCSVIELTSKMLFKALCFKPTVVHCNDTMVLPLGVIVKIITGAKLIYDAHELESNRNGLAKMLGKLVFLTEKLLWGFVDTLIVVSPSIQTWYKENIGKKCSEVILNSPALADNNKEFDKTYLRKRFSIPDSSKVFIYIGILGEGRGIDLIIEAFKSNGLSSHLVFLGYGKLKKELERIAMKHPNIHVHGAVAYEQVISVAKSADVGLCFIQNVSLSDYYCLPNKLFEYCFAEIPVLASDFPDISHIVAQYNLGRCSELSSESILNVIKEFEAMDDLPKIKAQFLYQLSWEAQETKLIRLYGELTKAKVRK